MNWRRHYHADVGVTMRGGVAVRHLRVRRLSGLDGIGWDVLQRIKNDVLGEDVLAIEVYPPNEQLVNETNTRHLWEVPHDLVSRIPSLAN